MKNLKTNWFLKHTFTVFSCVLIIVLGIAFLSHADPVTTTIGENIATNDLSVTGNVTSGTWQGTAVGTQYGGTGQDWSAVAQGNLPYFSAEGALSNLAPGTAGQFLKSQGTGADPEWANVTRSATFVVAANDSSTLSKQQADYVCDGTDDQVEIQAAIDAVNVLGGGKVLVLSGSYELSNFLTVKENVVLEGESWNTEIYTPTSGLSYVIRCFDNSVVKNLKIIGEGKDSGGTQMGIVAITGSVNVRIINNEITQTPNDAIILGGSDGWALNNYVHDIHEGIEFGTSSFVAYNTIENSVQESMEILGDPAEKVIIFGNTLKNSGTIGIKFYGSGTFKDILIEGNKIINSTNAAIRDSSNGATIQRIKIVNNIIREGNTVINLGYLNSISDSAISGNIISGSVGYGIQINSDIINSKVCDNIVATTAHYGIILQGNSDDNQICGNIVKGSTVGITMTDSASAGNLIANNYVSGTYPISVPINNKIHNNIGYTTENSGTTTITAAATTVDVTHSLATTPTRIQLTPTTDTAGKRYWISAKGATTFTITIDSTHTSDISFDWRAVVGEGN